MRKTLIGPGKPALTRLPGFALIAGVALGFQTVALTQTTASATPAATTAKVESIGPKLVLPKEKIDVGTVPKGEVIHQAFVLKNEGKADLHVTDVKPSCGCTVPEYDKVIKAGGEGKVTLNIDTKTFQGAISKTALVLTDDPATPQVTLFLSANVKPFVEMHPYGFFRIQALTGETGTSEMILVSDEPDFKPTKVESPQPYLKAALAPVSEKERLPNKGPNQYKVTLTTLPETPEGLLSGYVKVATGIKKQPELELSVSGFMRPTVTLTPASINFGNFDPKSETTKRKVMLVNNNTKNEAFAVTRAESNVDGISAEIKPVENDKNRVEVFLTVDQARVKKGAFDGTIVVRTNDTARSEMKVPIKGVIL